MEEILKKFGLLPNDCIIQPLKIGLINTTQIVTYKPTNTRYILQKINTNVFANPQNISNNILLISDYVKKNHPEYLFTSPVLTVDGNDLVVYNNEYYRMFPYVEDSKTYTTLSNPALAFEAAKQFGKFTSVLSGLDISKFKNTIPDFHNLKLRYNQFIKALSDNSLNSSRRVKAKNEIDALIKAGNIVDEYLKITNSNRFKLRITHHDTKISNILFDEKNRGLCVIDLDTVMPGFYISDVGDMCRTYLSAYNEEEKDISKVEVRIDYFEAIAKGYLSEMGNILTQEEKEYFVYAGEFLIYMQALRFMTDYLNGDVYYQITYPEQNLVRTRNQIQLLKSYQSKKSVLRQIVIKSVKD